MGLGYKAYLPVNDIRKFVCVGQPLEVKFDATQLAKQDANFINYNHYNNNNNNNNNK